MKKELLHLLAPLLLSLSLSVHATAKPQCEDLSFPEGEGYDFGTRCFWPGSTLRAVWRDFYQRQQSQYFGKTLRQNLVPGKNVTDKLPDDENGYPTNQYKWAGKKHLELTLFFGGGVTTITLDEGEKGTTIIEHYSPD
ncbi:hypothetical protein [Leminorella grimontii]|uniref:hypothetical protein n=1 Tax=Leminorella grimontii TaxID=82981 RepID=UPI0020874086|nr:hypothetical protein [Leminorella grimontii]GKX57719.1 hypothetical protein SOASR031_00340 [Leminorella grimontii]